MMVSNFNFFYKKMASISSWKVRFSPLMITSACDRRWCVKKSTELNKLSALMACLVKYYIFIYSEFIQADNC